MEKAIENIVGEHRGRGLNHRNFFTRLIATTGTYAAAEENKLEAAVVFYGTAPTEKQLAEVHCPVFGIYGEADERITSKVPEVAAAMKKLENFYESKICKGAAHAFFNDASAERYNAKAAKDAWTQLQAFL